MPESKHTIHFYWCLCLFVFYSGNILSRNPFILSKSAPQGRLHTRVTVGPVISFYKINTNHAANPKQKMSGLFSVKGEFRLNSQHTAFFLFGAEYMIHGLNFNSYYFKPDSIQLYTGEMNYKYALNIHEIDIPLQLKLSFTKENNSLFSPYAMIGYHFRTLLFSDLTVSQNGEIVEAKKESLEFKNPLFTPRNNPFVSVTLGFQRNWPNSSRNCLYMELSYRLGFSPYLLKDTFTPSALYINGNHLSLGLGVKF
jgi:hypothetical protein